MPEGGEAERVLTLEDLIVALDRHEKTPSNVPRVETFHFDGERVSDWLDLVEQAMVGLSDEVKFQRIMRYVLHRHHQEVQKVVDAAHGSWARFRENMLRKYWLGDGLLTIQDLEGMNKDDFTTIGAFVQEFKKKARKVHRISEERQCAIFLGLLTGSEAAELTNHGGGNAKLTWATIDRGVEDGSLDQVEKHQMRLQRRKRKERDATASGTPGVKRIITDVLAALGYGQDAEAQRKAVAVVQGRGKEVGDEAAGQEDYGGEETGSQILTKAQRKQRNLLQGGQRSGKGQAPQAIAAPPVAFVTTPISTGSAPMGPPPTCGHWVPHCQAAPWPSCSHCTSCGGGQTHTGQMVAFSSPSTSAEPPSFPATQGKFTAQPAPSQQASQASVAGGGGQGQAGQGNGGRGQGGRGGGGRGRNGGGRGANECRRGGASQQAISQGSQGNQVNQGIPQGAHSQQGNQSNNQLQQHGQQQQVVYSGPMSHLGTSPSQTMLGAAMGQSMVPLGAAFPAFSNLRINPAFNPAFDPTGAQHGAHMPMYGMPNGAGHAFMPWIPQQGGLSSLYSAQLFPNGGLPSPAVHSGTGVGTLGQQPAT
ncbi:hypothetical protein CBR_g4058 [Chara braunii]|uniref:Retrotransposon gag domain-containing protein n=1 Tax=Chara braunii TaxID=69332 RepID=A0A388KH21_CHABU|nr:hypothetical protein CBR_g4058 [Chara braunii]|eukprot:GBG69364.1 hypothetical protein CBR_g4058 [Chara braunii]